VEGTVIRRRRLLMALAPLAASAAILAGCGDDDTSPAVDSGGQASTPVESTGGTGSTAPADTTATDPTTTPSTVGDDPIAVTLEEQNGSGVTGDANLIGVDGGKTRVRIALEGSQGGPHPAHIHRGTCDDLDPEPAFPLTDVVDGISGTNVEVPIDELRDEDYAINVHESAQNADRYIACGDID
jgi:hypothetical protein